MVQLPADVEMVMPGDNVAIEVELITPIALEKKRFAIREGGRTIGSGVVTEVTVIPQERDNPSPTAGWSMNEKIKVRPKAYDDKLLDQTVEEIVRTVKRTGAQIVGQFLFRPRFTSIRSALSACGQKVT